MNSKVIRLGNLLFSYCVYEPIATNTIYYLLNIIIQDRILVISPCHYPEIQGRICLLDTCIHEKSTRCLSMQELHCNGSLGCDC